MPSEKYYYSHSGADFENLKILGLCCALELPQNWPSDAPIQYLHLQDMQNQNLLERRFDHAESTTRWTFAYRLNLPVVETVFVEIDNAKATTPDFTELSNSVLRFLTTHLPDDRTVMAPASGPTWQSVATPASPWPPDFGTLDLISGPTQSTASQTTSSAQLDTDTNGKRGNGLGIGLAILVVLVLIGIMSGKPLPTVPGVYGSQAIVPQPQLPAVPLPQPTPYPTSAPCPFGCTTNPSNICPLTVIEGIVTPSNQRLYYEPGHPEYNKQNVHTEVGDRWFCTIQEAANNGFVPAPR